MAPVPTVSILLPTYNRAAFLPPALEAIRAQTFGDWELIVVDDGSTDDTEAVVRARTADWSQPVRYVRQANAGAYGARNTALDLAAGKYVAFYDSDDVWLEHHLQACVGAMEENPDVDWVYGASQLVNHDTGEVKAASSFYVGDKPRPFLQLKHRVAGGQLRIIEDGRAAECAILKGLYAGLQVSVIRREIFAGFRFEATKRNEAEDQTLVVHALVAGRKLAYFNALHLVYHVHDANSSATGGQSLEKHVRIFRALAEGYEELPAKVTLTTAQRRALHHRLSKEYFWHLGYVLFKHPGRGDEALGYFRHGLRYRPWSAVLWGAYLIFWLRVKTGLGLGPAPRPTRSASPVIPQPAAKLLSLFLRRCPVEGARWRLIPMGLRLARSLPPETVRTVATRHGFRMRVRLGDWLGRHVYVTGEYEPATSQVFRALLRPGATFLDVGANAGYFSLLASRCVGPTGRVLAFEPVPETREDLLANVRLNGMGNVQVFEQALSNAAGTASFSVGPTDHRGTSSLRSLEDGSATLTVETARLDDLLPPGQKVDCVKIDIEGAEYLALQGMAECLRRDRPDLVIEITDSFLRALGHSAEMLCWMLAELGYRMYCINHKGLVPFEPESAAALGQYNALFTARRELPAGLAVLQQVGQACASSI